MIHQFYISTTALSAYQKVMVNITNNVANAQTPGFKGSRVELESLFPGILEEMTQLQAEEYRQRSGKRRRVDFGTGVKIADVRKDFRQGQIEITNRPLDWAVQGRGFFRFRMRDGSIAYSRAGNLQIDQDGNIIDPNGHLLDPPIRIPENSTAVTVDSEGRIFVQTNNETGGREIGQVLLARFPNDSGLQSIGQNLFVETELSGRPIVETPGRNAMGAVAQFSLEYSNVNIINEMMQMVIIQRAFELASRAIQSGEQMLKAAEDIVKGG